MGASGALAESRNYSSQPSIGSGTPTLTIVMDGDRQDPPELIPEIIRRRFSGHTLQGLLPPAVHGRPAEE